MLDIKAQFFRRCGEVQPVKTLFHRIIGLVGRKGSSRETCDRAGSNHVQGSR